MPPVRMAAEWVRYNTQDDNFVMEDELLGKVKVRKQGRKQEKGKEKDIHKDGDVAHKATDQTIEAHLGSQ